MSSWRTAPSPASRPPPTPTTRDPSGPASPATTPTSRPPSAAGATSGSPPGSAPGTSRRPSPRSRPRHSSSRKPATPTAPSPNSTPSKPASPPPSPAWFSPARATAPMRPPPARSRLASPRSCAGSPRRERQVDRLLQRQAGALGPQAVELVLAEGGAQALHRAGMFGDVALGDVAAEDPLGFLRRAEQVGGAGGVAEAQLGAGDRDQPVGRRGPAAGGPDEAQCVARQAVGLGVLARMVGQEAEAAQQHGAVLVVAHHPGHLQGLLVGRPGPVVVAVDPGHLAHHVQRRGQQRQLADPTGQGRGLLAQSQRRLVVGPVTDVARGR